MPNVVVVGGTIQCSHGGVVQLASGSGLLGIAGAAALTSGMEAGLSFAPGAPGVRTPCPCTTPPPASKPSPCTATLSATAGISTQLTVGGQGVLLDSASGVTVNAGAVPPPALTWSVAEAGQTLVSVDQ